MATQDDASIENPQRTDRSKTHECVLQGTILQLGPHSVVSGTDKMKSSETIVPR